MTHRFFYLLGVVCLLAVASALSDARRGASGVVRTATGETCRECAAYAPTSGVYRKPSPKESTP
ncbi:MAG: hypothetical protein H7Y38_10025 [Armatimonadetes bacterium]|nr:hypothetical protein [Armatimonadota bacterium]